LGVGCIDPILLCPARCRRGKYDQAKDEVVQAKEEIVQALHDSLQAKDKVVQAKDEVVQAKDEVVKVQQKLLDTTVVLNDVQKTLDLRTAELMEAQGCLSMRGVIGG
jgi:uncharacterized protein (DUF3084 family)